jgi:hypothetical protein
MRQDGEPAQAQLVGQHADRPGPVLKPRRLRHRAQPVAGPVHAHHPHLSRGQQLGRELDRTTPPASAQGRYRPPDQLLAFLEAL